MTQLSGTRVLMAGGTSGLGRAMAQALAQAGARVAVTSRHLERAQAAAAELGAGALGVELDVRDESSVAAAIDAAYGLLDSEQTMTRRGFVPYGPSGAAVEALARVMAADLADTPVTANILLPGGATATGMIPEEMPAELRANLLDSAIMGPPIVWLASADADGVHDERIVARDFDDRLGARER
jgi:NAD(P)-dependent dehydrogenase (short-subunit alcohol dehydrogenase family)